MGFRSVLAAGSLMAVCATPAMAGAILKPISATVYSGGTSVGSVLHLIDGSGMSTNYSSGQDYDQYIASKPVHSNDAGSIWRSSQPSTTALLMFDFGEEVELNGFTIWTDLASSVSSVTFGVYNIPNYPMYLNAIQGLGFSYNGDGSGKVGTQSIALRSASGQAVKGQYFGFQIYGCDNAQALTDGCGMGEVVFNSTRPVVVASVPEPATWAFMILGLAGVGAVMRRRSANLVAVIAH